MCFSSSLPCEPIQTLHHPLSPSANQRGNSHATSSEAQCIDTGVVTERHSNDTPREPSSGRERFVADRICEHIQMNIPAGQPFTSALMDSVGVRRDTTARILRDLSKKGFFTRTASGVYVHDGRFPVRHKVVRSTPRPAQKQTRIAMVRAYIGEQFLPGQVFQVSDVAVPGFGNTVGVSLAALKRSGYLVSAGYGRYSVWQGEQTIADIQFMRPRLRAEVLELPDAHTFSPDDFQHLGNRMQVGNALVTLEREGTIARVGPAQYIRTDSHPAQKNESFSARVLQRIRELPSGQTFTRNSSVLNDLGTPDALKGAYEYLLSCREIMRVGWGIYVAVDNKATLAPIMILSIKQQALLQIEARVPYHEKFTVELLDIPKSLKALNGVLSELSREGVIERVALGVYVRTLPRSQRAGSEEK